MVMWYARNNSHIFKSYFKEVEVLVKYILTMALPNQSRPGAKQQSIYDTD